MRGILILYFFMVFLTINAQELTFERITTDDGLAQNNVLAILQDRDGYMWFATYDGLNRYDGYEFKVFRADGTENSLPSNLLHKLMEDKSNNIWIATFDDGFCKFDKTTETFTQFRNTPENPNLIADNTVKHLMCDSKNNIWACTNTGVNILTEDYDGTYSIQIIKHNPEDPESLFLNDIEEAAEDAQGRIWVCGNTCLDLMIKGEKGEFQNKFVHLATDLEYVDMRALYEVPEGYLVSHHFGAFILKLNPENPVTSQIIRLEDHASLALQFDADGNFYAGGHNGLYFFEHRHGEKIPYVITKHITEGEGEYFLSNQFIRSLYMDRSGILWLGTNGGGILKYNSKRIKFRHYTKTKTPGSLSHSKVWCVYEDKEKNVWIGTEGGGANVLPVERKKNYTSGFEHYGVNRINEQNFVFDLVDVTRENETPRLIAGLGYSTLATMFTKLEDGWDTTRILWELTHQIMVLHQDDYGTVWIGSYMGGLAKHFPYEPDRETIIYTTANSSIHTNIIRSISEDSKGRLWIGTNKGLMLLTPGQKLSDSLQFTLFTHDPFVETSISNSYTVPIIERRNGEIWIGTFGGGLNKYVEGTTLTNGSFTHITTSDGLPNNTIKAIIEDNDGKLWFTSNKGLSRYDPIRKTVRNFTIHDGLQDLEFVDLAGAKLHDGEILVGGVKGFNAFYPEEISEDTTPPRIIFNEIEVMNKIVQVNEPIDNNVILTKTLNLTKEIILNHTQNSFKISFAAIQYTAPEGNRFKYMLDGFDKDWSSASTESLFANYTNLPIGKYTFKVIAANSDGYWTRVPKQLEIWIKPPFWLNTWFRISALIFIIMLISGIVLFRFYLIKKQNEELEKEVSSRTKEIKEKSILLEQQTEALNETNTQLEERQQVIEEQAEELRTQRDILEDTNATKDKYYSILAHDLKGPFNTLLGYLEMLELKYDSIDDNKRKSRIHTALESSLILNRLVDNLLQWSRSQRGLIPFNPNKTILHNEINEVISVLEPSAKSKGIVLKYYTEDETISAHIDTDMFKTIMRNLISNAIKYTSLEGVVSVSVEKQKKYVLIKIVDTGIGIPEDIVPKLFKIDSKHSTLGTNDERGTGLGLVLCKEFIDTHKGEIAIDSVEGEGTTISFTLPIHPINKSNQQ